MTLHALRLQAPLDWCYLHSRTCLYVFMHACSDCMDDL